MMTFLMGFGIAMGIGVAVAIEMAGGFKGFMLEVFGVSIAGDSKFDGNYLAAFGEAYD